ncbi:hypothetical protein ONR57_22950 [Hoyosella sp. YIM 151337]|uniref:hypothetical protein n=1 Tax=Hoyosella sp. YIM 151337 TaxID=2992742 RepID=UPI0022356FC6|nr:hypothetical protein [Hoyosella sp. YIM 151337]MCW4356169.1 hypothetical protein [Hoyosella sp. YIM 151337]
MTSNVKVSARSQARKRTQEALAERRRRDRENAEALDSFFESVETESQIDDEIEREIAKVRARAEDKKSRLAESKRAALEALQRNEETIGSIADLTGLSTKDVRAVLGTTRSAKKNSAADAAGSGAGSAAESAA